MKKKLFASFIFFIFVQAIVPQKLAAQKYRKEFVVTGGIGYSITGILFSVMANELNANDLKTSKTPVVVGSVDYGITDRVSFGLTYTYQGIAAKYTSYNQVDSNGDTNIVAGDFHESMSRQSIGFRPLFHFGDNDAIDIYSGARFSYVFWNYSGAREGFNPSQVFKGFSPVKVQVLFGIRYFMIPNLGIGAEFGVGPTYYLSFGIHGQFGGMP